MENLEQKMIGKEFKNFAEVYNFILKPNTPFTSKMGSPNYVGLKRGDNSFTGTDGIENILIKDGQTDPNYRNEFYDHLNIWLETCVSEDKSKRVNWVNDRFNNKKKLRVFLNQSGTYICKGIYKQMDSKLESYTVAWKRVK